MKLIIAGAGIGGLSAALACLARGHEVHVFEQARGLEEVGAGIQVPANAMRVLDALGLGADLGARAFAPAQIETRMGKTGRVLFQIALHTRGGDPVWGAPYYHLHRADLIACLSEALAARAPQALQLGVRVETYTQDADGVSAALSDGRVVRADALIGADGLQSAVRTQMLGQDRPVFTGNVAWRAVVPVQHLAHRPPPSACAWMGSGRHAVTYYVRGGALANFVGVVERDEEAGEERWDGRGDKAQALRDFAGWDPAVSGLIDAAETVYRWPLYDRTPLKTWCQGRVALLGDAAHPMLPFLAQGGAMAIEDAWVLAAQLSAPGQPVATALAAYQARRYVRASRVQALSRANAKTFHQRTRLGQTMTYGPMWLGGRLAPGLVRRRLDWLYDYDVTAAHAGSSSSPNPAA